MLYHSILYYTILGQGRMDEQVACHGLSGLLRTLRAPAGPEGPTGRGRRAGRQAVGLLCCMMAWPDDTVLVDSLLRSVRLTARCFRVLTPNLPT